MPKNRSSPECVSGDDRFLGILPGLVIGAGRAAENIGVGAWNFATALVPNYHGFSRDHDHTLGEA